MSYHVIFSEKHIIDTINFLVSCAEAISQIGIYIIEEIFDRHYRVGVI